MTVPLRSGVSRRVAQSPIAQGFDDRAQTAPLLCQRIFESRRMIRVRPALDDACGFQRLEAIRQNVWCNSTQRFLQVLKPA
jgi:hypothetical protein